jgi:sortase A
MAFRNPRRDSSRAQHRRYLRLGQYVCLLIAALFLGRSALGYVRLRVVQLYDAWEFSHGLVTETVAPRREVSSQGLAPARPVRLAKGQLVGKLEIPRIGVSAMVLQGDDDDILDDGAGHVPSSALPGEMGNVAVAAHRDTLFRGLRNIRVGDDIQFQTAAGVYRYQVESMAKVSPRDVDVLNASAQPTLTLITCYPFNFIGHAPLRFVVKALEIDAPQSPLRQDQQQVADSRPFAGEAGDSTIAPARVMASPASRDFASRPAPAPQPTADTTPFMASAPENDVHTVGHVAKLEAAASIGPAASPESAPAHVSHSSARSAEKPHFIQASHEEADAANDVAADATVTQSHKKMSRLRSWLGAIPGHFKKDHAETPASD